MGYPVDMFLPADTCHLKAGQLVLDEQTLSLAVRVDDRGDDRGDSEMFLLGLQGVGKFNSAHPGAHRRCCVLSDNYKLTARAVGLPVPAVSSYSTGQLIVSGDNVFIVSQAHSREYVVYSLAGEERILRGNETAVVYDQWELWLVDANGKTVDAEPVATSARS